MVTYNEYQDAAFQKLMEMREKMNQEDMEESARLEKILKEETEKEAKRLEGDTNAMSNLEKIRKSEEKEQEKKDKEIKKETEPKSEVEGPEAPKPLKESAELESEHKTFKLRVQLTEHLKQLANFISETNPKSDKKKHSEIISDIDKFLSYLKTEEKEEFDEYRQARKHIQEFTSQIFWFGLENIISDADKFLVVYNMQFHDIYEWTFLSDYAQIQLFPFLIKILDDYKEMFVKLVKSKPEDQKKIKMDHLNNVKNIYQKAKHDIDQKEFRSWKHGGEERFESRIKDIDEELSNLRK